MSNFWRTLLNRLFNTTLTKTPVIELSLKDFVSTKTPTGLSPYDIVDKVAQKYYDKVDPITGLWEGIIDDKHRLDISRAKEIIFLVLRGVTQNNVDYLDRGLLGIKSILSFQDPMNLLDASGNTYFYSGSPGSFPAQDFGEKSKQHSEHHKTIVMGAVAQALSVAKNSTYYTSRKSQIDSLIVKLSVTANWLVTSEDYINFFKNTDGNANQFMSNILFIHITGVLTNNIALKNEARAKLEWLFANMVSSDGVFKEKFSLDGVGFDTVYQLFTLRMLSDYIMHLPMDSWRTQVLGKLHLGYTRWVKCLDPVTGLVDDSNSSRTIARETLEPNKIDTWDNAATGYSLYLGHYMLGNSDFKVPLNVVALNQIKGGQTFTHIEKD